MINRAHVIGMGRLGRHWADRLSALNVTVHRWSRTAQDGVRSMSEWSHAEPADAVFIAVPDDAIASVAESILPHLPGSTALVHHAGSVPLEALPVEPERRAVMWPPMTFTAGSSPDWNTLPLGIEAADPQWMQLGLRMTPQAFALTATSRPALHLGAVLAGNLTAAWLGVVESYLEQHGLPLSALAPLVEESVKRALEGGALDTVSGPASRNDADTLQRQAAALNCLSHPDQDLTSIHTLLTNRILAQHGHPPLPLQGETEGH